MYPATAAAERGLRDREPVLATSRRKELVHRLLAGRCELCGQADKVHVHQVRKLAELDKPGQPEQPEWMRLMATRRRKTLVVCEACYASIRHGKPTASNTDSHWRAR